MKYYSYLFAGILIASAINPPAQALGNHPESNICPGDKPYFVFCSHSLHNLEGWFGECYTTKKAAEQAVQEHADKEHKGNSRWTGVRQASSRKY